VFEDLSGVAASPLASSPLWINGATVIVSFVISDVHTFHSHNDHPASPNMIDEASPMAESIIKQLQRESAELNERLYQFRKLLGAFPDLSMLDVIGPEARTRMIIITAMSSAEVGPHLRDVALRVKASRGKVPTCEPRMRSMRPELNSRIKPAPSKRSSSPRMWPAVPESHRSPGGASDTAHVSMAGNKLSLAGPNGPRHRRQDAATGRNQAARHDPAFWKRYFERHPQNHRHDAVQSTVQLFENAILEHYRSNDRRSDAWITIVPEIVHRYVRPQAAGPKFSTPSVLISEEVGCRDSAPRRRLVPRNVPTYCSVGHSSRRGGCRNAGPDC
jgi:hypothetical protein